MIFWNDFRREMAMWCLGRQKNNDVDVKYFASGPLVG